MTPSDKFTASAAKVARVIKSCYTIQQLEVARCMLYNFYRQYHSSQTLHSIFEKKYKEIQVAFSTTIDDGTEHF